MKDSDLSHCSISLSKFPAVDASGFGGEVDADLENCLSFGKERTIIAHSLNLLQGSFRVLIPFQFNDVNESLSFHHNVYPAVAGMQLGRHLLSHQAEKSC